MTLTHGYDMDHLIARIREAIVSASTEREFLWRVTHHFKRVLAEPDLIDRYHLPPDGDYEPRLVHRDAEHDFIIDFSRFPPGERTGIHDHGDAWALTGAYRGELLSIDYRRRDDGSVDGEAEIEEVNQATVRAGDVLAMPVPAIHRNANVADELFVGFNIYGRDLTRIWRNAFDIEKRTVKRICFGPTRVLERKQP